jgi:ribosomal protein L29
MELLKLRFAAATSQLKNPHKKKDLRKDIARILTIMKEKEDARPLKAKN